MFRSGVRLVQTGVVVHDKNGQPVNDLTAADFRIFEDGKEQKIEVFAIETDRPAPAAVTRVPAAAAPRRHGVYQPRRREERCGVTVILFDRLNSSLEDQKQARDQIVKLLAKSDPGDRIAVYVLESDAVTVLHDFTTDASRLIAVVQRYLGAELGRAHALRGNGAAVRADRD